MPKTYEELLAYHREWKRQKRRAMGAYEKGRKLACKNGHPYPESLRPGRKDCSICHREQALARKRALGVKPRGERRTECSRGHRFPENLRPGRSDCAICHREDSRRRYHRDPEKHREAARQYQKAHRVECTDRQREWKHANAERMREIWRRRRLGYDDTAVEYERVLRGDPCVYCGDPMREIDHIRPVSHGGKSGWDNLAPACRSCNSSKNDASLLGYLLRRPTTEEPCPTP